MFERAVWLVPAADPAGRAWLNFPVTYTRLPTTTCAQATPSIWTVGRASALTVVCVTGGTGAVSASAGPDCSNGTASASVTVATKLPATRRRRFFTCVSIMLPLEGLEDSTPPRASRHRTVGRAVTARQALLGKRSSLVTLRRNATRRSRAKRPRTPGSSTEGDRRQERKTRMRAALLDETSTRTWERAEAGTRNTYVPDADAPALREPCSGFAGEEAEGAAGVPAPLP